MEDAVNWSTPLSPVNQHSQRDDDLNAGQRPLANQSHSEIPRELSTWQHVEKTPRECSGAEDIVNVALRVSCSRLRTCRKLLQRLRGDPLKRERFVGEFLEGHHTVVRYEPELRPAFIIDLNALTGHARRPLKYLTCPTAFLAARAGQASDLRWDLGPVVLPGRGWDHTLDCEFITQVAAQHAAQRGTHCAKQERHEGPECKVFRTLSRCVGGLGGLRGEC